jgi:hypothetical protein
LYDATDGLSQQWRMLEELNGPTTDAIVFAAARGWMIVEAGHSICLTDAGRALDGNRTPRWNTHDAHTRVVR